MSVELFECERMGAKISKAQCDRNRYGVPNKANRAGRPACLSCEGCPGLGVAVGELEPVVHDPSPIADEGKSKIIVSEVQFAEEEVIVAEKICDVPGCTTKRHSRGKCWKHVKSVLGINPSTGKPLDSLGSLSVKKSSPPPCSTVPRKHIGRGASCVAATV